MDSEGTSGGDDRTWWDDPDLIRVTPEEWKDRGRLCAPEWAQVLISAAFGLTKPTLAELHEAYIWVCWAQCRGNKARMARILGVAPSTLHRWFEHLERAGTPRMVWLGDPELRGETDDAV